MKNKQVIITLGVVGAIVVASYVAYQVLKGKGAASPAAKKQTATTAKQVAQAAAAAKSNPSDAALQAAYLKLGEDFVKAALQTNKSATSSKKPDGTPITVVDSNGNYIENGDSSTLYDNGGHAIADLDPSTGMFVSRSTGQVCANADGSPASLDANGNVTESDGSKYTLDGTPIQDNGDGTYTELDNNGNRLDTYTYAGEKVGTNVTADNSPLPTVDNQYSYSDPRSNTNDPNYDPYSDPNSPDYIGASGYRSSFGNKTIHSLFKK